MATQTAEDFEGDAEELELDEDDLAGESPGVAILGDDDDEPKEPDEGGDDDTPYTLEGDEIDPELRGLSPADASRLFTQLKTASQTIAQQLSATRAQPAAPAPTPEPVEVPTITSDDVLSDDGKLNQKLEKFFEIKAQPALAELAQLRATTAYTTAMNSEAYPYLKRYKSEVDAIVSRLPATNVTPAAMGQIHAGLLQAHFDEIAADRARVRQAQPPVTETTKGRSGAPPGARGVKLSAEQKHMAKMLDVSESDYAKMLPLTNQGQ